MAIWLPVFFFTPILEMYLLLEVGSQIGVLPTVTLVMATAVIGVLLLKRQGLATLTRGLKRLDRGELPAQEVAEGLLLAVAGALLVTPGFVTDGIGFLLLAPPARARAAARLLSRVTVVGGEGSPPGPGAADGGRGPVTIEGEFQRRPEPPADP